MTTTQDSWTVAGRTFSSRLIVGTGKYKDYQTNADAARAADRLAALPELSTAAVRADLRAHAVATWRERAFYRLLNRMLFRACAPDRRWRVLSRFYKLRPPLIERFYAGRATLADKARILTGKPPVPVGAALKVLRESSVMESSQ